MLTPHKIHAILRKAGFFRQDYDSRYYPVRVEGDRPQLWLDSDGATRRRIKETLEREGIKIQPSLIRDLVIYLDQEPND